MVGLLVSTAIAFAQSGETSETVDTYSGPSVLSRGGTSVTGERGGQLVNFQLYGDVNAVYDSGLAGVVTESNGNLELNGSAFGITAGGGIVGTRTWEFDQISLDYSGDYRHYSSASLYDGTDQFLRFNWRHLINRHWSLDVHEAGGITSLSYGTLSYVPVREPDVVGLPTDLLFDTRTYFDQTGAELFWQKSSRLSIGIGGDGFLTDYQQGFLNGARGGDGKADAVYRLTRRQKVYLTYQISRFDFQHAFGFTNLNLGAAGYSIDIGHNYAIEVQGGVYYVHTLGLTQQPLPPQIAQILGISTITTTADDRSIVPDAVVRLTRRFRRSAVNVGAGETVVPGNGVFLTSRSQTAYASYSMVGTKKISLSATFGYGRLTGVGQQILGNYGSYNGGLGAVYRIMNHVSSEARYDYYHYSTNNSGFRQNENRVTFGVNFSTGGRPLSLW